MDQFHDACCQLANMIEVGSYRLTDSRLFCQITLALVMNVLPAVSAVAELLDIIADDVIVFAPVIVSLL